MATYLKNEMYIDDQNTIGEILTSIGIRYNVIRQARDVMRDGHVAIAYLTRYDLGWVKTKKLDGHVALANSNSGGMQILFHFKPNDYSYAWGDYYPGTGRLKLITCSKEKFTPYKEIPLAQERYNDMLETNTLELSVYERILLQAMSEEEIAWFITKSDMFNGAFKDWGYEEDEVKIRDFHLLKNFLEHSYIESPEDIDMDLKDLALKLMRHIEIYCEVIF